LAETNIAIELLEREKHELEKTDIGRRLSEINTALTVLTHSNAILVVDRGQGPDDWSDLRPLDAAKKWLREIGGPQTTTEIAQALRERGVKTNSKDFVTSLHATLKNSKDIKRLGEGREGRWTLSASRRH